MPCLIRDSLSQIALFELLTYGQCFWTTLFTVRVLEKAYELSQQAAQAVEAGKLCHHYLQKQNLNFQPQWNTVNSVIIKQHNLAFHQNQTISNQRPVLWYPNQVDLIKQLFHHAHLPPQHAQKIELCTTYSIFVITRKISTSITEIERNVFNFYLPFLPLSSHP